LSGTLLDVTRTPSLLIPGTSLTEPELRSATLDGELVPLGEGYLPVDAPLTPLARALSLAPLLVEPRILMSHRTAAWVWGWLETRPVMSTSVPVGARISSGRRRRLGTREVVITEGDVHRWGDLGVTTRVRTAIDLARHDEGDDITLVLARGLRDHPALREAVARRLNGRTRASHIRRARERMAAAMSLSDASAVADAVDVVDRVDAAHSVEHPVEVRRVAHLEDESTEREPVA